MTNDVNDCEGYRINFCWPDTWFVIATPPLAGEAIPLTLRVRLLRCPARGGTLSNDRLVCKMWRQGLSLTW